MRQRRRTVDRDLYRIITALRNRIRAQGYTQLEVQEVLGWGRSYISQLLTRQKALRIEQILQILLVINVAPADFFDEIYPFGDAFSPARPQPARPGRRRAKSSPAYDDLRNGLRRLRRSYDGIVRVLIRKNLITEDDLAAAVARFRDGGAAPRGTTRRPVGELRGWTA